MKILIDGDAEEIPGAVVLGVDGDETINCILDTMYAKAPQPVIRRAVHIQPTPSGLIPTMRGDLKPPESTSEKRARRFHTHAVLFMEHKYLFGNKEYSFKELKRNGCTAH